jgi:hypothetical protein
MSNLTYTTPPEYGFWADGNINKHSFSDIVYQFTTSLINAYLYHDRFNLNLSSTKSLEEAMYEYRNEPCGENNTKYTVSLNNADLKVAALLIKNIKATEFEISPSCTYVHFDNIDSARVFITVYNDIIAGVALELVDGYIDQN